MYLTLYFRTKCWGCTPSTIGHTVIVMVSTKPTFLQQTINMTHTGDSESMWKLTILSASTQMLLKYWSINLTSGMCWVTPKIIS